MLPLTCRRPADLDVGPAIRGLLDDNGTYAQAQVRIAASAHPFFDLPQAPPHDGGSPFFDLPQAAADEGGSPFHLPQAPPYDGASPLFDLPQPPLQEEELSWEEFLDSITVKESPIATSSSSSLHCRRPPVSSLTPVRRGPPIRKTYVQSGAGVPSWQDELSLDELLDSMTVKESSRTASHSPSLQADAHHPMEVSPPSRHYVSSSSGPRILYRNPFGWPKTFYIRVDVEGSFHTYPHLGGPFQSLQEANKAIDCHLNDLRHPSMYKEQRDKVSPMEWAVRLSLYWPDGTRKKCSNSKQLERDRNERILLVQAIVDKYNEDHNLYGDLAYELKHFLHYQYINERPSYYHFNFTAKTKGDFDCGIEDLFFAEVTITGGEHTEVVITCSCVVNPNDNGHCYGCTNNANVDMKHPNDANSYFGGHWEEPFSYGYNQEWSDSDETDEAHEERIRHMFKCLDDPVFMENRLKLPPGATLIVDEEGRPRGGPRIVTE